MEEAIRGRRLDFRVEILLLCLSGTESGAANRAIPEPLGPESLRREISNVFHLWAFRESQAWNRWNFHSEKARSLRNDNKISRQ